MLEPVPGRTGLVGRKAKEAAPGKSIIFAMEIDAGVMAPVMENTPHVRADSTQIEHIIQGFVDERPGRDRVVIAVMGYVQQKKSLCEAAQKIDRDKLPGTGPKRIQNNPCTHEDRQPHSDLDPHRTVRFGRSGWISKKSVQTTA